MTTGLAPPVFPACPSPETPNEQIGFAPGNTIYFTTYYRDLLSSQQSHYYIYFPDGTLTLDWTHNSPAAHYAASYWWWGITFPVGVDEGTYRFEVAFQGTTREHYFNVGSPSAAGRISNAVPLEASLEPDGDLTLDWGGSCAAADSDYAVYEGILGSNASHVPVLCSTGGLTEASITPGADSRYYIVVARTASREGSHGVDSAGFERPRGPSACLPQAIATCP